MLITLLEHLTKNVLMLKKSIPNVEKLVLQEMEPTILMINTKLYPVMDFLLLAKLNKI